MLQEVKDNYTAVVKMVDSGDKLKLDQNHVETVIPAPGETAWIGDINKNQQVGLLLFKLSNLLQVKKS